MCIRDRLKATHITALETVDQALIRSILSAHKSTTKEVLYLETGTIPIRWIIPQRRINYLKHILSRNKNELIRKVFEAQKEHPTKGDFIELVTKDLKQFELTYDEVASENMSKQVLKKELRKRAEKLAFTELRIGIAQGKKAKDLRYSELKMQEYLKSEHLSNDEAKVMVALRSKCLKGIKGNFKHMHKVCQHCPLQCNIEEPQEDSQEHLLKCKAVGGSNIEMDFMHASHVEQGLLAKEVLRVMTIREQLLEDRGVSDACCRLPGANLDQRTQPGAATIPV